MTQVFIDLDGVLADFDRHYEDVFGERPDKAADNVDWQKVREIPTFYADLPLMPDAMVLWDFVSQLKAPPIILTGVPRLISEEAAANKRAWVDLNLGENVRMIGCRSRDKSLYAKPGDILIDDWEKYRHIWLAAGGRWITHTSADRSIDQLLDLGIGL